MKFVAVFVCFIGTPLVACGYLPTAGPTTGEVLDQGVQDDQIRYDVVDVDANVVSALLAQPEESFRRRFGKNGKPLPPKIGIGDTVLVSIWEAAGGGLFGASPTGHVTAADVSPAMAEKARERLGKAPNASVSVEDGQALSFADCGCAAVLCNLWPMFFPEPVGALRVSSLASPRQSRGRLGQHRRRALL